MSGRAGRRGKDDLGLAILVVDQQMSADIAKDIIKANYSLFLLGLGYLLTLFCRFLGETGAIELSVSSNL